MYLDDNKVTLIKKLKKIHPEGGYVLTAAAELTTEDYSVEALISDMRFLNESGYIDLKYCDAKELCLRVTAKGVDFLESLSDDADQASSDGVKYFKYVFLGSFSGAVAAFLLVVVILSVYYR